MHPTTAELPIPARVPRGLSRTFPRRSPALALVLSVALTAFVVRRGADVAVPEATSVAPAFAATDFTRRASHDGRYLAEVVGVEPVGDTSAERWIVRLTRRDHRRVANARLDAQIWMPESGTPSPVAAAVRYVGGGRYAIEPVSMPHAGWWNVALVIDGVSGTDSVAFNVIR